ncbi:hypothetical protein [Rhodopirellula bahusiensis]|uniref:Uncharacterized protein n=1 Tax=Rhodopirellula bahusiensis TaxID=2014065 RepID=A0A2G1W298_9BACT|nr:hypothetical protein [Rhodopirellula bahusiensis]PHQ33143.1 hypothetical protein CEE69_22030 [Rhodopirellula bahusiensis]
MIDENDIRPADLATWSATLIGWCGTAIAFAITTCIAIYGCGQAEHANQIAVAALNQNDQLHRDNQEFAVRLKDYEVSLAEPRLVLLRYRRLAANRYVATLQNDGQRQAVIFGAHLHPGYEEPKVGSIGEHPLVPESLKVPTIKISFSDPGELNVELPIPAVIDSGDIVSLDITFSDDFTEGEVLIDQGIGQPLPVGRYRVRAMNPRFPTGPSNSINDLFGAPLPTSEN